MNKNLFLLFIYCSFTYFVNAQLDFLPHKQNGGLIQVMYDQKLPNTLYGITDSGNNIFIAADNGISLDTLFMPNITEQNYKQNSSWYLNTINRLYYAEITIEGRIFTIQNIPGFGIDQHYFMNYEDHGNILTLSIPIENPSLTKSITVPFNENIIWITAYNQLTGAEKLLKLDHSNEDELLYYLNNFIIENYPNKIILHANDMVYISIDRGNNLSINSSGLYDHGNQNIYDLINVPNQEGHYLVAGSNGIYYTKNNANNWERILQGSFHKVKCSTINPNVWIAIEYRCAQCITNGRILLTKDAGENWQEVFHPELENMIFYSSFTIFKENEIHVYLDVYNMGPAMFVINLDTLTVEGRDLISKKQITVYPNQTSDYIILNQKNILS